MTPARRRVLHALLLGVAVSVGVTLLSRVGALAGWETRALDAFLFFRDRVPAPEIVLVLIDEDAFKELGERQPLSRRYLAELANFLLRAGARVVAFDVLVTTPTSADEDGALLAVARGAGAGGRGRLVFNSVATPRPATSPARYELAPPFSPELRPLVGFSNAPVGADGVVRRMAPLLPAADGGALPSFAVLTLAAAAGTGGQDLERTLREGRALALPVRAGGALRHEPIDVATLGGSGWRIDYAGPPGALASFPSGAIVQLARTGVVPEADNPFRDRIVLVGGTFQESRDFHPTPLGVMAGVEIQANMIHTLLSRRALLPPPWWLNLGLLLAACLAMSLLSLWLRPRWVAVTTVGLVTGLVALSYEAYTSGGYWLDFVAPALGMLAYLQGARAVARRRLRAAFGQYVSPEVMERVLREGAEFGGEVRPVSVLMSDLRGFTTMSEKLPPARITATMNEYLTAMVDVILGHHGMVSDFIGDGILAFFGAPTGDPDHAWHAVQTALGMQVALRRLNEGWAAEGRAALAMGIAVNTGEVFAGNVGSPRKKKYAVMGDPVNTVSRIEGLNRELGTAILISGATLAVVKGRVVVRDRGSAMVKGKAQPVELFELLGMEGEAPTGTGGGPT